MSPSTVVTAILAICLVLVIAVFALGFSVGRTLCAIRAPDPKTARPALPGGG